MSHYANCFSVPKYIVLFLHIALKAQWSRYTTVKEIVEIKFKGNLLIIISINTSKYYGSIKKSI